jgi:alanyl-tRNA synthetase
MSVLRDVEARVNHLLVEDLEVHAEIMTQEQARAAGAMALFGEKYGDRVRVISVGDWARELCGGTHVANTGEVGIFKITSEGSSAANVRRVEAITGPAAIDFFREREAQLQEAGEVLGNAQDPVAAARRAAEQLKEAGAGAEKAQREQLGGEADALASGAVDFAFGDESGRLLVAEVKKDLQANPKQLLELANRLQSKLGKPSVVVLGSEFAGKAGLVALANVGGVSDGSIIREIAPIVGGGGGGRDDMAQAGGKDPAKLDEALAAARAAVERDLG